jgi:hypothetical protein
MKYFSPLGVNSARVSKALIPGLVVLTALGIVYALFGLNQAASAIGGTVLVITLPIAAGILYNYFTNKKRVKEIANILKVSETDVLNMEVKYYLS